MRQCRRWDGRYPALVRQQSSTKSNQTHWEHTMEMLEYSFRTHVVESAGFTPDCLDCDGRYLALVG